MNFELEPHQVEAIAKLRHGSVLLGGVGSGKSITSLAWSTKNHPGKHIYVITTAKKRDSAEWFEDAMMMSLRNELTVDSWNNIDKYTDIKDAVFIFDEQRLVGSGAWVKAFYKIAQNNTWILLSATPADTWMDLIPVFVANGFYRNKTDFCQQHVRWARFVKFPKVDSYIDPWLMAHHRDQIFVEMPYLKTTVREEHIVEVEYDRKEELRLYKDRWNFYEDQPLKDAGEMVRLLRKSTNAHWSRIEEIKKISVDHPKLIIFYNHNYELDILRTLLTTLDIPLAEWNGHNHEDVPLTDRWIYLVQYQAGSEGWNCVATDTMVFYSLPYSYRNFEQAKGRIDRLNTPFEVLHYYILRSRSIIDQGIWRGLSRKKNFHVSAFAKKSWVKAA